MVVGQREIPVLQSNKSSVSCPKAPIIDHDFTCFRPVIPLFYQVLFRQNGREYQVLPMAYHPAL